MYLGNSFILNDYFNDLRTFVLNNSKNIFFAKKSCNVGIISQLSYTACTFLLYNNDGGDIFFRLIVSKLRYAPQEKTNDIYTRSCETTSTYAALGRVPKYTRLIIGEVVFGL